MAAPALVILAAGESARLGACKALVRLRRKEPATPLGLLLEAGAVLDDAPLVVTGADHTRIAAALPKGIEALENPAWAAGRTGGVARAALRRPGRDLCIAPVDVPLVPASVFAALAVAWHEAGAPARGWLAPWVERAGARRFGHPVIVGRELAAHLADWPPGRALRELRDRADPLLAVRVEAAEILDDLDGPEDLDALRRRTS